MQAVEILRRCLEPIRKQFATGTNDDFTHWLEGYLYSFGVSVPIDLGERARELVSILSGPEPSVILMELSSWLLAVPVKASPTSLLTYLMEVCRHGELAKRSSECETSVCNWSEYVELLTILSTSLLHQWAQAYCSNKCSNTVQLHLHEVEQARKEFHDPQGLLAILKRWHLAGSWHVDSGPNFELRLVSAFVTYILMRSKQESRRLCDNDTNGNTWRHLRPGQIYLQLWGLAVGSCTSNPPMSYASNYNLKLTEYNLL